MTSSRDAQEINERQALRVLYILHHFEHDKDILDDAGDWLEVEAIVAGAASSLLSSSSSSSSPLVSSSEAKVDADGATEGVTVVEKGIVEVVEVEEKVSMKEESEVMVIQEDGELDSDERDGSGGGGG